MALFRGPKIITNGLILSLDAADKLSYPGSGTSWKDLTGTNSASTLINGPTFSAANLGCIVFDGTNDYVDSINVSSLTDMTIELWIYDTRSSGQRDILTYNGDLGAYTFNGDTFRTDGNSLGGRSFSGVGEPPLNQWYRFCYVKNNELYINKTMYTGTGSDRTYGTLSFANTRSNIGSMLNGRIASIKVYNRNLSSIEISQNYNAVKSRYGL